MSKPITAEKSHLHVMPFEPPVINLGIPGVALDLLERNRENASGFHLSELNRSQTGIQKLEQENFEARVESEALAKLKEIQEQAYREAFDLGLAEGREKAFEEASLHIQEKLKNFEELMAGLQNLKRDLLTYNEAHLVQLTFRIAERLAGHEIQANPEATVEILRQAVAVAQSEEEIVVRVAPEQLEFLETLKAKTGRDFEFLKNAKLEPDPGVEAGGCIVQNNYGEIDSRFSERVGKLWDVLKDSLVRIKDQLKSVS